MMPAVTMGSMGYLEWDVSDLLLGLGRSQPEQQQSARDGELEQQATRIDRRSWREKGGGWPCEDRGVFRPPAGRRPPGNDEELNNQQPNEEPSCRSENLA